MSAYTNGPIHTRSRWIRPQAYKASVADPTWRVVIPFRSSCGHTLGVAAVLGSRQVAIVWKSCR